MEHPVTTNPSQRRKPPTGPPRCLLDDTPDLEPYHSAADDSARVALVKHQPPRRRGLDNRSQTVAGALANEDRGAAAPLIVGDDREPITVQRTQPRSLWPLLLALAIAAGVGPATAWLLIYAPLATTYRFGVAAVVPVGLALLGVASTLLDRDERE